MLDRGFFEALSALPAGEGQEVVTVVSGSRRGAKAILAGERILWRRDPLGFFLGDWDRGVVFGEVIRGQRQLYICGAGHVGLALIPIAGLLGFDITVIEDRKEAAEKAERAGADRVLCRDFESALSEVEGGSQAYFVVLTREHQFDALCLKYIMEKEFAYAGAMGSRRKSAYLREYLIDEGIPKERVDRLQAPIGLSIGAETEGEIAVSIGAQLVQQGRGADNFPRKLIREALGAKEPFVMATVISRRGSAPRGAGAKMLIFAAGQTGTIGGGTLEARVTERARQMLSAGEKEDVWQQVDLTGGGHMMCGGVVEVLLEAVR